MFVNPDLAKKIQLKAKYRNMEIATRFQEAMFDRLVEHDDKGGWDQDDPMDLAVNGLQPKVDALIEEIVHGDGKNLQTLAADAANYLMMIFDLSEDK